MKCPKCNTENPDTLKFCGECGTKLPTIEDIEVTETIEAPKEELTTGSTFAGRYQIIEELGRGGMGEVYRAEDTNLMRQVAIKEALEVCRQIAEGLESAHQKGIIHQDLKPGIIKTAPEGKIKILDFGLAKAFQEEPETKQCCPIRRGPG